MTHGEFQIGKDFWCGGQQWRCTDIGTRVIVAISVGAREVTELNVGVSGERELLCLVTDSPEWLVGPPYAVGETVFDEDDFPACTNTESSELI